MKPAYLITTTIANFICIVLSIIWFFNTKDIEPVIVFLTLIVPFIFELIQLVKYRKLYHLSKNPYKIDDIFFTIDKELLGLERSLVKNSDKDIWIKTVNTFLNDKSDESTGISYNQLIKGVTRFNFYKWVKEFSPGLTIYIDKKLSKIRYSDKNNELIIKKPSLLWDCNCYLKNPTKKCPIHFKENTKYNLWLADSFSNNFSKIRWKNIEIMWKGGIDLWPPSFDLLKSLDPIIKFLSNYRVNSIYEYWSNTGTFGIYLLQNIKSANKYYHYNQFLRASLYTNINLILNQQAHNLKNTVFFNQVKRLENKVDLLVCQPPYLADFNGKFQKIREQTLIGDNEILFNALSFGKKNANRMIFIIGLMILDTFIDYVRKLDLSYEVIYKFKSPFRVTEAFRNEKFLDALIENNLITHTENKSHDFEHMIGVIHIY